jgi:hypothetical protein
MTHQNAAVGPRNKIKFHMENPLVPGGDRISPLVLSIKNGEIVSLPYT